MSLVSYCPLTTCAKKNSIREGGGATAPASPAGSNEVRLYTFSKSFGMAGWRVGYMSYPSHLHEAMLKVQDTLPTHATRYSQRLALAALTQLGTGWARERVASLEEVRPRWPILLR